MKSQLERSAKGNRHLPVCGPRSMPGRGETTRLEALWRLAQRRGNDNLANVFKPNVITPFTQFVERDGYG